MSLAAKFLKQELLARRSFVVSGQHFLFVLLQLRRDEPFAILQRLLADEAIRNLVCDAVWVTSK